MRLRRAIVLAVSIALGIGGCATDKKQTIEEVDGETVTNALLTLRERAAFELNCPSQTIHVGETAPGSQRFTAGGCGKTTTFQARCEAVDGADGKFVRCAVWDTAASPEPPDRQAQLRASTLEMPLSKRAVNAVRTEAEREFACNDVVVLQVSVEKYSVYDTMWKPERDVREGGILGASGCGKRRDYHVHCELGLGGCRVQPRP